MQVDPIKPTLKAPGSKRLKLKYDELLSSFGFNFNLRHYTLGADGHTPKERGRGVLGADEAAEKLGKEGGAG